jgi:hypothetical protein
VCSSSGITTTHCTAGKCDGTCNAGFADCDNDKLSNGCEINTQTDPNHCGGCTSKVCSGTHIGSPSCASGICNGTCDTGFADCNSNKLSDGCETQTTLSATNCGGCNMACSGTDRYCSNIGNGGCVTCVAGSTANCDSVMSNGCETNLKNDAANCGACGVICQAVGGSNTCVNGTCTPSCDSDHLDCDGDPKNGCEVNIKTDKNNCGACSKVCATANASSTSCSNGVCQPVCNTPFKDCDSHPENGCESNTSSDNSNCNGCGNVCANSGTTSNTCTSGVCVAVCDSLHQNCDSNPNNGCESTKATDDNNCGACGNVCHQDGGVGGINACGSGVCVPKCDSTHSDCNGNVNDGCETLSSVANCGGNNCAPCDTTNSNGAACNSNVCTYTSCKAGFLDCQNADPNTNGCETPEDATHCGSGCVTCNQPPHTTGAACKSHLCGYTACNTGFIDCDGVVGNGCEVDTSSDINNCGGCGHVCPTPAYGAATCAAGICGAACIMDAGVSLKQCVRGGGNIDCGQCCGDSECMTPPDKCHETAGTCSSGFCVYALKACTRVDCYSEPVCNLNTGNCDSTPQNGGACGGTGCYVGGVTGTCNAGTCVDGNNNPLQLLNCSQNVPVCKVGVCNRLGMCDVADAPNGTACTSSDMCQISPTCMNGSCVGASVKTCSPSTQCRVANCNAANGNCVEQIAQAGTACSTSDPCRVTELCDDSGNCVGQPKPDGNPCNLSDCMSGGICLAGNCTCADSLDMSMSQNPPPDMAQKPKGHDTSGCDFGGGGSAGLLVVMMTLLALIALRRRAR